MNLFSKILLKEESGNDASDAWLAPARENKAVIAQKNDEMPDEPVSLFGFDLGDGESSVAWTRSDTYAAPLLMEVTGRKSIITALGETEDDILIGDDAYMCDPKRLYVRFKSRYLKKPEQIRPIISKFASKVYSELLKTGKLDDKSRFFVGCPSGWKDAYRERYKKIFL
ncbi:MAG: hypothetical protein Q4D04_11690, partial [Clostridia bacterium]|nr:hypothetical protein [Clostridia bacterium]